jgi:flagellar biosynthesis/type III secretory pathway M-ring protein FliF/YscJ
MRGEVLKPDDATGPGLILGEDGKRYQFTSARVHKGAALAAGAGGDPAATGTATGPAALPGAAEDTLISVAQVEGQMRASALKALAEMVDSNPDQAVAVVRRWLAPEDGTA